MIIAELSILKQFVILLHDPTFKSKICNIKSNKTGLE